MKRTISILVVVMLLIACGDGVKSAFAQTSISDKQNVKTEYNNLIKIEAHLRKLSQSVVILEKYGDKLPWYKENYEETIHEGRFTHSIRFNGLNQQVAKPRKLVAFLKGRNINNENIVKDATELLSIGLINAIISSKPDYRQLELICNITRDLLGLPLSGELHNGQPISVVSPTIKECKADLEKSSIKSIYFRMQETFSQYQLQGNILGKTLFSVGWDNEKHCPLKDYKPKYEKKDRYTLGVNRSRGGNCVERFVNKL